MYHEPIMRLLNPLRNDGSKQARYSRRSWWGSKVSGSKDLKNPWKTDFFKVWDDWTTKAMTKKLEKGIYKIKKHLQHVFQTFPNIYPTFFHHVPSCSRTFPPVFFSVKKTQRLVGDDEDPGPRPSLLARSPETGRSIQSKSFFLWSLRLVSFFGRFQDVWHLGWTNTWTKKMEKNLWKTRF